jgi:signal transduction histidine kinase
MRWFNCFTPFYNLRIALLGFVLIPVMMIIMLGGSYSLQTLEQQVEARMQEDIELIARAIRLPLSHALEQNRISSIERALTSAFRIDRVYGAYVYDHNGNQIASSGTPAAQVGTKQAAKLAADGSRRGEFSRASGERIFSYFVPLTDTGGRINGLLQVTRRGSDFSDYISKVRGLALIALTGICIILIVVVLLGHYGAVGRHLRNIKNGMIQVGPGVGTHCIPVHGPSEIRVLANGINAMIDRITTSRKELEHRREREMELRIQLQQTEKMAAIGQLASGVAHELGTPLSTIDGKSQQLLRKKELPDIVILALQQIRIEVARMEHIIRQLLDFGRRNPLKYTQIECSTMIKKALDRIESEIKSNNVEVIINQSEIPRIINVDTVRIEQALTNVLQNAIHACNKKIEIGWYSMQDKIQIIIEDDGPGIDEDMISSIFNPFFTTKAVGQGTGLGLSVAHAAVTDHGGDIEADYSNTLGGACFRITLQGDSKT